MGRDRIGRLYFCIQNNASRSRRDGLCMYACTLRHFRQQRCAAALLLMPGWLTRIIHTLLRWTGRGAFRVNPTNRAVDPRLTAEETLTEPAPAPNQTAVAPAIAFEPPCVPSSISALNLDSPPPPAALTPVVSLARKAFADETSQSPESGLECTLPSQAAPQTAPNSFSGPSAEGAVPSPEAHDNAVLTNSAEQWEFSADPPETSAHRMASVAIPDAEDKPQDGSDTAEPSNAPEAGEAPQESLLLPEPELPTEPPAAAARVNDVSAIPEGTAAGHSQGSSESTDAPAAGEGGQPQPPSRYRPRLRERSGSAAPRTKSSSQQTSGVGSLDAELMLIFQPGGWDISVSLLLRRAEGMPEEAAIRVGGETVQALAIDQMYFEPLPLPSIGSALEDGIAVETAGAPRGRWVRTGRTLHVFSERPGIPGFSSVPRVVIGQENVILCTTGISGDVLTFCATTGTDHLVEVTGPGVAEGWRCFRGYRPKHPAESASAEEILLALNPLPDAAIELSDGISVSRGSWIADRPPAVRIIGVEPAEGEVEIDGRHAAFDGTCWTAPGWNQPGRHVVRYAGLSRAYDIVEGEDSWPAWPAHDGQQFSVCGAAVSSRLGARAIVLSLPGCWLLGAEPGQVCWADPAVYGTAIAAPAFEPVWAILPRVGRTRPAPRLLVPVALPPPPAARTPPAALRRWLQLLCDAPAHLAEPEADVLWQLYRHAARSLKAERRR